MIKMPRGDRTGPAGAGPRSRANEWKGFVLLHLISHTGIYEPRLWFGRGWGRDFGRGLGWRKWSYSGYIPSAPGPKDEK